MHYKKEHGDFPAGFEGMEVLQCDVCPAQFIKAKALKNHKQRTHDIGLPEVLACDRFMIVAFSRFFLHYLLKGDYI